MTVYLVLLHSQSFTDHKATSFWAFITAVGCVPGLVLSMTGADDTDAGLGP